MEQQAQIIADNFVLQKFGYFEMRLLLLKVIISAVGLEP
ncbi:hypothetical protein WES_03471 [Escherichia sp. KTE31]|nr:hypothetical protein WEW_03549 [Escherichia coli KTE33]EOU48133.1 hypothetical protein WC5_00503 [Escherichia sp. KTE114]EOU77455.1 hypothetical protein WES_03471 [Escherichia sp. KTE31]EQV89318.1 hypothetical protein G893_03393 [Escherichia coli KOEGE 71 (186a)]